MLSRHQLEGSNKKGTWPHSQLIKLSYLALKRPKTWAWFASCFFSCCLRASVAWSAEGWGGAGLSRAHTRERLRRLTTDKWLVSRSGSPQWVGSTCLRRANIFQETQKIYSSAAFLYHWGKRNLWCVLHFSGWGWAPQQSAAPCRKLSSQGWNNYHFSDGLKSLI